MLPLDLVKVIISYLPLKKLQLWQESNPNLFTNQFNDQWFYQKYGLSAFDLTKDIDNKVLNLLTNFELHCYVAMNMGDIGYLAQFYLPVDIILAYCIKAKDLELLEYYLLRYIQLPKPNKPILDVLSLVVDHHNIDFFSDQTKILTYLADMYFQPALALLKKFGLYNQTNIIEPNVSTIYFNNILDYLINIEPDKFQQVLNNKSIIFPTMYFSFIAHKMRDQGLITSFTINNASKMFKIINNNFYKNGAVNDYLNILKLLLNQDFDITPYIGTDGIVDRQLTSLAFSVLNGPICRKIIAINQSTDFYHPLVSEVLYDIDFYCKLHQVYTNIDISIYLAKQQYKFINNNINNLIDKSNQLMLYKTYNKINNYNKRQQENYFGTISIEIYDAETAKRLSDIIDVNSFLLPATEFDKDLMIQFGFNHINSGLLLNK